MTKLAQARALADEWAEQAKEAARDSAITHHFDRVGPRGLVGMWETNRNPKGKTLDRFEFGALVEAWLRVFGEFPPFDDDSADQSEAPAAPETELPPDDTMLRTKEVLRLISVSESSLKRMVLDGRFPKPMRLSPRRIGWKASDVRLWLDGLDGARRKVRN
jgi:prophage regulatory protein